LNRIEVKAVDRLCGEIEPPGDKSISHRSVFLGSLVSGTMRIHRFLPSQDCLRTVVCMRQLGVGISGPEDGDLVVEGCGMKGLTEPSNVLNTGNSGTAMRLLLGILAAQGFFSVVTGDDSVRRRPMSRITRPLAEMGARIWGRDDGRYAPIAVKGGQLRGIRHVSQVASAQVKSCLLLAGLYAAGSTQMVERFKSRDHTERMMAYLGLPLKVEGNAVSITPVKEIQARDLTVPGDISSAAFLICAAAVTPGSHLIVRNVGVNPTRTGFIDALLAMGARVTLVNEREICNEPVADVTVTGVPQLEGICVRGALVPRMIDEFPAFAVAAACARGTTVVRDAAELRVKESDRIQVMAEEFGKLGVILKPRNDGFEIRGPQRFQSGVVDSHGDHRVAMALAMAGLMSAGSVVINDTECIETSFPGFAGHVNDISGGLCVQSRENSRSQ